MLRVAGNCVAEWTYETLRRYADPFNEVELDVVFTEPGGATRVVPTYWAGGQTWGVRYSSPVAGIHRYRTVCSDPTNPDLHGREGQLEVTPYDGTNPLLLHGPLRVAADRHHLEHSDGTPFLWLGDTWWMALCRRLRWPDEFRELVADRVAKGFNVVQIVAGLYPDMPAFDPRGANEAGFPWEQDWSRINPAYFDMADLRIAYLVRSGIVPCIVGSWGYYIDFAGDGVLRKHWRNLVARWGAYPVIWCVSGEALMTYYLGRRPPEEMEPILKQLRVRWTEMTQTIRRLDQGRNLITIHPTRFGHDQVSDPSVLDIDMLQTGHSGYRSLAHTIDFVEESLACTPTMPVLVSEVDYEGIMESSREEMQRFLFWSCLLSGAAGHTYGANGLWQLNRREQPYGASPHGMAWGHRPWDEAYQLPGSGQLGLAKRLLERYPWWRFEIHPEWIEPHQTAEDRMQAYAAGIPGQLRVIFIPADAIRGVRLGTTLLKGLEPGVGYRAFYFDPKSGEEHAIGQIAGDANGECKPALPPVLQDWVLVMEAM